MKRPPLFNNSETLRYDSVNKEDVYCVFDNNKAYPLYLLEIKELIF